MRCALVKSDKPIALTDTHYTVMLYVYVISVKKSSSLAFKQNSPEF